MADEQKADLVEETAPIQEAEEVKETQEQKENSYTEKQLEEAVRSRLARERAKMYRELGTDKLDEAKSAIEEKKSRELDRKKERGEFEDILKQQADEHKNETEKLQKKLETIQVSDSLLSSASRHQAINPDQVSNLLKSKVKLNDEGKVEVLADSGQPRYNKQGELLSVDEYVQEFITQNPHFQSATPSGSGSRANVGKVDAKPFNIADLDMTNPDDRKRYAQYKKERDSKPTVINLT